MKKKGNPKLDALKAQMKDMGNDYQDMIKAREESKRQLDGKFSDVYKRIEDNKQFTTSEGARVMATLTSFQEQFEKKLETAKDTIGKEMQEEKKDLTEQLAMMAKKLAALEKGVADEREERRRKTEENLAPIRQEIESTGPTHA